MRNALDFSSWQGVVSTLLGLVVVSLVAVGIRLLVMHGVQQRRERQNRQINERLKTLIAAYKTLGGSFTGDLAVDPSHLRHLRGRAPAESATPGDALRTDATSADGPGADRRRRVRDAVEAALADVILLGTEAQVRLAVRAANEMVAGRSVEIAELVVSLRTFIRDVLDLDPVPAELAIPKQGPVRATGGGGRAAASERGGTGGGRGGGGAGAGGGLGGAGVGAGGAIGGGLGLHHGALREADDGIDHGVGS
jgi:heme exporter protein D